MMLSVDLSYYPLKDDFKPPIREIIARLQASNVDVRPNPLGTQLFGDYQEVMDLLNDTMKWSFETYGKAVFVAKFVEGDRR